MSYRADKQVIDTHTDTHTHTDRHTDRGDDNTRRPKLASGKNDELMWTYGVYFASVWGNHYRVIKIFDCVHVEAGQCMGKFTQHPVQRSAETKYICRYVIRKQTWGTWHGHMYWATHQHTSYVTPYINSGYCGVWVIFISHVDFFVLHI